MACPKCGHQQPDGLDECQACSVIISKFLAAQERYDTAAEEPCEQGGVYHEYTEPGTTDEETPEWAKNPWLYILFGLGFIAFGFWEYQDLVAFEREGGTRTMHALLAGLYDLFGKWGVAGAFFAVGAMFLGSGFKGLTSY